MLGRERSIFLKTRLKTDPIETGAPWPIGRPNGDHKLTVRDIVIFYYFVRMEARMFEFGGGGPAASIFVEIPDFQLPNSIGIWNSIPIPRFPKSEITETLFLNININISVC
jgi:hypothetical protein